jgi:hypothetical protein
VRAHFLDHHDAISPVRRRLNTEEGTILRLQAGASMHPVGVIPHSAKWHIITLIANLWISDAISDLMILMSSYARGCEKRLRTRLGVR